MPRRFRLSRKKGARKPAGAIVISRPSKWGNPHKIGRLTREQAIAAYKRDLYAGKLRFTLADVKRELKGRDIACWCRLEDACPGDLLMAIANRRRP
jgi:hypothetical protein